MKTRYRCRALALLGAASVSLFAPLALAQSDAPREFNVPAGTLAEAVATFTRQSGIRVSIGTPEVAGTRVRGVRGSYSDREAFTRMLDGSGLSWHYERGVIVVDGVVAPAAPGERVLSAVQVEGAEGGFGMSLSGFGSGAGANGSSDVAATEGTRSLTTNGTSVATKGAVSLRQTPQTVAVITSEQIKQQNMTDVLSALQFTPGITLARNAGNGRLQNNVILSRGFAVTTFVVDGGAPINYQNRGGQNTPDLSQYDRIEILKGSAALFGGSSDPGGVVNLQRKRPLDERRVSGAVHIGSWMDFRTELDLSSPIAFDGALRARGVVAYHNQDFFYDYANQETANFYGVIEADLGPSTILRMGGSYKIQDGSGDLSSGLPRYGDGGDLRLPRSTNLSLPWAYTRNRNDEQFLQLDHRFSENWQFNASFTRTAHRLRSLLPQFQGPILADGGDLIYDGAAYSTSNSVQYALDAHLNGAFELFGLTQKFLVGADYQDSSLRYDVRQQILGEFLNVFDPDLRRFSAYPGIPDPQNEGGIITMQKVPNHQYGLYANLMLEPIEGLHINGGLRWSNYFSTADIASFFYFGGMEFGSANLTGNRVKNVFTPSASIVYDIADDISIYASYADIFNYPGAYLTVDGDLLPPQRGATYEAGIKAELADGRVNASLSAFRIDDKNIPLLSGFGPGSAAGACCFVPGAAIRNTGFELQVAGEVLPGWQINAGYTYLKQKFNEAYNQSLDGSIPFSTTQQPKHQIKLWSAYTPTWLSEFTLLTGFRLESKRSSIGFACPERPTTFCEVDLEQISFNQPTYAVADLGLEFRPDTHWVIGLTVNNITNARYYSSVGTPSYLNFYGEPRKVLLSVRTTY